MPTSNDPLVVMVPLKPALIAGVAQKLPVLVRVQAPDSPVAEKRERKPYHLSLVIDRSGSMSGPPLREAVRCARHIVDRMDPSDSASIVAFDDRVKVLADAGLVGDRKKLHAALSQLYPGGSTNLHGGWLAGADSILPGATGSALARVILLSDGNANVGETTETSEIAGLCSNAAAKGVSTSTYGVGRNFNEDLMVEMAKAGQGNHYYGDTAADLFEPFAEEFDLISSLFARHVRLSLAAPAGVKITLLNDYPVEERDGFPVIRLPDIPYGAEAWALLELEIPAALAIDAGTQVLQAGVVAVAPEGQPIAFLDQSLTVQAVSPPAWDAMLPDALVVARIAEVSAAKFLEAARQAAQRGDWEAIQHMIDDAKRQFADHPWVSEMLDEMAEIAQAMDLARFSKEARYSSRKMSSRLSAKEELLDSLAAESSAASFLRRKRLQGKSQFDDRPDET